MSDKVSKCDERSETGVFEMLNWFSIFNEHFVPEESRYQWLCNIAGQSKKETCKDVGSQSGFDGIKGYSEVYRIEKEQHMSDNACKCDRCGILFETDSRHTRECVRLHRYVRFCSVEDGVFVLEGDLCPECSKELQDWFFLKEKKQNYVADYGPYIQRPDSDEV